MLEEDPAQAPILWKERWFYDGGVIPPGAESDYEDLDLKVEALKGLQEFLQEYADKGTIFTEPKKDKKDKEDTESEEDKKFNSFSNSFKKLYVNAYPKDKSVSRASFNAALICGSPSSTVPAHMETWGKSGAVKVYPPFSGVTRRG